MSAKKDYLETQLIINEQALAAARNTIIKQERLGGPTDDIKKRVINYEQEIQFLNKQIELLDATMPTLKNTR